MNDERRKSPDLLLRTKSFALRVIRLYTAISKDTLTEVLGKQVLRSATSVGAQYREARRARSRAEFCSKVQCCVQEMEETVYWLELIADSEIVKKSRLIELQREANELLAILITSVKTAKSKD
jgi:four helix bundle protein